MPQFHWSVLALLVFATPALAQRDAPVWSSYLSTITLYDERTTTDFDLTFCKSGGPYEHTEHQLYVLAYLEKDEAKILELAADKKLTNKEQKDGKLLLEVLEDKKLVTILESQVAKKEKSEKVEPGATEKKHARGGKEFNYSFSFDNRVLFKSIAKLKNFDSENFVDSDARYYHDKFKFLIFVPVNNCRYAGKVSKELQTTNDFAHYMDTETILLYFKPLPYRFEIKPLKTEDVVLVYVD